MTSSSRSIADSANAARLLPLFLAFILIFSLLPTSSAFDPLTPQRVRSADFYLYDQQSVSVSGGTVENISINYSLPINSSLTVSPAKSVVLNDSNGNPYLAISASPTQLPYVFSVNASVTAHASRIGALPQDWSSPADGARYLASTPDVPANDSSMRDLARQITANASTPFEQISALARWVHDDLTYDADMVGQMPPASQILQQRRGVCTEYSTLFVTLARSLGYPARFVNGYAYSDLYREQSVPWLGHTWVEVYIGRWVPVDPTWLEVGNVDGTHIISSRAPTLDSQSVSISAYVRPPSAKLIWNHAEVRGALADNVHLLSVQQDEPDQNYSLFASSHLLPSGGRFLAVLAYPARDYRLLSADLTPCTSFGGSSIVTLDQTLERLTTEPNQTAYAIWTGQASDSLDSSSRFRCPLTLNSPYLNLQSMDINISTAEPPAWPALDASLASSSVPAGSAQTVSIRLPTSMAGQPVTIVEGQMMMQKAAGPDGRVAFSFPALHRGVHTLYAFSTAGDPVMLQYSVGSSSDASLSNLRPPRSPTIRQPASFEIDWSPGALATGGWSMHWSWNSESGTMPLPPENGPISFTFTPSVAGENPLTLQVLNREGHEMLRAVYPIRVLDLSDVSLTRTVVEAAEGGQARVSLWVSQQGYVNNLQLHLPGRTLDVPTDGSLSFIVPAEDMDASLTWNDGTGSPRRVGFTLAASSAAPNSLSMPSIPSSLELHKTTFCPSGLVLFLLPPAAMLAAKKKKERKEAGSTTDESDD